MLLLVHDSSTHEKINGSKDIVVSRSTTSISHPAHPGTFSWVKFASVEPCLQLIKVHQLNSACIHRRRTLAKLGKRAGNQCWRALAQGSASRGFQPRKHQRCPVPQRQSFAIGLDLGPYFLSIYHNFLPQLIHVVCRFGFSNSAASILQTSSPCNGTRT